MFKAYSGNLTDQFYNINQYGICTELKCNWSNASDGNVNYSTSKNMF
jgi:hypothetical protein